MDEDGIQSRGSWKKAKGKKRGAAIVAALLIIAALIIGIWAFGADGADAHEAIGPLFRKSSDV